jgi:SecD/SecF fusion protein
MLRFAPWKVASILLVSVLALLVIVPSFWSKATFDSVTKAAPWLPIRQIVLGLDLQGGAHVVLEVDTPDVVRTMVANLRDDVRRVLREEKVAISGGIGMQARGVQVRVPGVDDRAKVMPKLRRLTPATGNALLGQVGGQGLEVTESPDGLIQIGITEAGVTDKVRRAVDQSIEVLRRRVDALGTTEPNIQRQGVDRVLVQVPGLQDTAKLKEILGTTAKLEFRFVAEPGANPGEVETLPNKDGDTEAGTIQIEKRVMVQGEDLTDAQPGFDQRTSELDRQFPLQHARRQRFGEIDGAECRQVASPSCSTTR